MNYAIVEMGRIRRMFTFPEPPEVVNLFEPDAILVGDDVHPDTHFWMDNEAKPIPARPQGAGWEFDFLTGVWYNNLVAAKDARWEDMKRIRTEIEFGPFMYNGMLFDGDLDAQRRLGTYTSISKSNPEFSASFILANNSAVDLSAADFIGIEIAKASQVADAFAVAAGLRNQIYAARTLEQVNAINWPDLT